LEFCAFECPKIAAVDDVTVGIEGDMERHQTRNFPFYAGTVASYGMVMK
jgi:hypothetical protein